jgi:hypothetical protein
MEVFAAAAAGPWSVDGQTAFSPPQHGLPDFRLRGVRSIPSAFSRIVARPIASSPIPKAEETPKARAWWPARTFIPPMFVGQDAPPVHLGRAIEAATEPAPIWSDRGRQSGEVAVGARRHSPASHVLPNRDFWEA